MFKSLIMVAFNSIIPTGREGVREKSKGGGGVCITALCVCGCKGVLAKDLHPIHPVARPPAESFETVRSLAHQPTYGPLNTTVA